jgi:RimJ/RimL family protein N-acetyltransferase
LIGPALPAGRLAELRHPTLDLGDLILRPWRHDDVPALVAAMADPAIQRWHVRSLTEVEARDWIDQWTDRWAAETGVGWAITDGGEAVGQIALRTLNLIDGVATISYWVAPAARGRGAAPRSLSAISAWSFDELGLHRLELNHSTLNHASCRVAEKAGFAAEGTERSSALHADGWHDMHHHARIAGE